MLFKKKTALRRNKVWFSFPPRLGLSTPPGTLLGGVFNSTVYVLC